MFDNILSQRILSSPTDGVQVEFRSVDREEVTVALAVVIRAPFANSPREYLRDVRVAWVE